MFDRQTTRFRQHPAGQSRSRTDDTARYLVISQWGAVFPTATRRPPYRKAEDGRARSRYKCAWKKVMMR